MEHVDLPIKDILSKKSAKHTKKGGFSKRKASRIPSLIAPRLSPSLARSLAPSSFISLAHKSFTGPLVLPLSPPHRRRLSKRKSRSVDEGDGGRRPRSPRILQRAHRRHDFFFLVLRERTCAASASSSSSVFAQVVGNQRNLSVLSFASAPEARGEGSGDKEAGAVAERQLADYPRRREHHHGQARRVP